MCISVRLWLKQPARRWRSYPCERAQSLVKKASLHVLCWELLPLLSLRASHFSHVMGNRPLPGEGQFSSAQEIEDVEVVGDVSSCFNFWQIIGGAWIATQKIWWQKDLPIFQVDSCCCGVPGPDSIGYVLMKPLLKCNLGLTSAFWFSVGLAVVGGL